MVIRYHPPLLIFFILMINYPKLLAWNCQATGNEGFHKTIKKMISDHKPTIMIIVETHISEDRVTLVATGLVFDQIDRMDPVGFFRWNLGPMEKRLCQCENHP